MTDFEALAGVGPVLAGRIVAWRDAHGSFTSVDQLREVEGIGERKFASLSAQVTV
jgi:competence protein ComEA